MPPKRVCGVPSNVTAPDSSAGLASEVGDSAEQRLAVDWSKCWRRRRPVMIHTYYDAGPRLRVVCTQFFCVQVPV